MQKNGRSFNIKFQNFPGEHAADPPASSPFGRGSGPAATYLPHTSLTALHASSNGPRKNPAHMQTAAYSAICPLLHHVHLFFFFFFIIAQNSVGSVTEENARWGLAIRRCDITTHQLAAVVPSSKNRVLVVSSKGFGRHCQWISRSSSVG